MADPLEQTPDETPSWLLEQQRKDDRATVALAIAAAPEWLDRDGVLAMLHTVLSECDDAALRSMAGVCIANYPPPSPPTEPHDYAAEVDEHGLPF